MTATRPDIAEERERFEAWYDAQPNGRLEPWDVWQAALATNPTPSTPSATQAQASTTEALRKAIRKLPMVRAREIDGEESDGTPISWRDRPYVSMTQLERLLASVQPAAQQAREVLP